MSSFLMPLSRSICSRTGSNSLFSTTSSSLNLYLGVQLGLGNACERERKHLLSDVLDLDLAIMDRLDRSPEMPAAVDRSEKMDVRSFPFEAFKILFLPQR